MHQLAKGYSDEDTGERGLPDYCRNWNGDLRRTTIPLGGFCADDVYP
jgi:hypothetical protein